MSPNNSIKKKFILLLFVILLQLSQFFLLCPPLPSPPPVPTVNPHTVVCVHESLIYVLWLVPSPFFHHISLPSGHCQSVPCFHVSGSILLVSLFCPLDSSYKWDHMVFVFYQLAYITYRNTLKLHPCCHKR